MSKIFYDRLVSLEGVEREINKIAETREEKEELMRIIDEYVHHRMMGCVLHHLPNEHHGHFLTQVTESPHHEGLLDFLKNKVGEDMEEFLKQEARLIGNEVMEIFQGKLHGKKKK